MKAAELRTHAICTLCHKPIVAKAAHRKLASENHPDKGGSPERMADINAAYQRAIA